jgi:autotransporter-associated beta strand protein
MVLLRMTSDRLRIEGMRRHAIRHFVGWAVLLGGCAWLWMSPAAAVTFTWSPDGADGGTGTWDTTLTNWNAGAVAWPTSGTDNDASFAGTAGTVTISGGVTVNDVSFGTAGYTVTGGTMTLNGTTPTITNAVAATISAPLAGSAGLRKAGAGTLTLSAANAYTGTTTITAGTLALSGGSNRLATAGTLSFTGSGRLDLGGGSQTLTNLTVAFGAANGTATLTGGSLVLDGASALNVTPSATTGGITATVDASGLTSLVISKAGQVVMVSGFNGSNGNTGRMILSSTSNTITALSVNVGSLTGAANGAPGVNSGRLDLGAANVINADTWQLGTIRSGGIVAFQSGLTNPTATLRAADGTSRVTTIMVGENSGGNSAVGTSHLDFSGGSVDLLVTDVILSRGATTATTVLGPAVNGSFSMGGGTVDATQIWLSRNDEFGANSTNTSSFTQGGGTVTVGTLTFAQTTRIATTFVPTFNSQYTLTSGTLKAATILAGTGTFSASTIRRINFNGGTLTHYDASTDLSINGVAGTGGSIGIVLGTTGSPTILADAGRTVTIGANTAITGSGSLTKTGAGGLVLNGANTYSGNTTISTGTLALGSAGSFANSPVITVGGAGSSGAVLDLTAKTGTFTFGAGQTVKGIGTIDIGAGKTVAILGTLAPGNSPGLLSVTGDLLLGASSTTLMEIAGLVRGTGYDATDVSGLLTYGGSMNLVFGSLFDDGASFNLFDFASQAGAFSSIVASGSYSATLADNGSGVWTGVAANGQTLTFTQSDGVLAIVPEPGTIALAGIGLAIAGWSLRKRRRVAQVIQR